MFSQVYVCLSQGCGSHVNITHNALDLGTYLPPPT